MDQPDKGTLLHRGGCRPAAARCLCPRAASLQLGTGTNCTSCGRLIAMIAKKARRLLYSDSSSAWTACREGGAEVTHGQEPTPSS